MAKYIDYLLLVLLPLQLLGCEALEEIWYGTLEINKDDLYGRYYADFGEAQVDYIELFKDSLFVYFYKANHDQVYVDTGRWEFSDRSDGRSRRYSIRLWDFNPRHPGKCREEVGLGKVIESMESDTSITDQELSNWRRLDKEIKEDTTNLKRYTLYKIKDNIIIDYCPEKYQTYARKLEEKGVDQEL